MSNGNLIGPGGQPLEKSGGMERPGTKPVGQVRFIVDEDTGEKYVCIADLKHYMAVVWQNMSAFTEAEFTRWEKQ